MTVKSAEPIQKISAEGMPQFPKGFVWGTATSSFQIEGAAFEDGRSPSIWDTFCATDGKIIDGTNGDVACDHYHLWEQDLDLIKSLGVQAYRFSIAWPRIIPTGKGEVNQKGLDFYERIVDGLIERGIEPHVTLYHWDLPQCLQDIGGWENRDVAYYFADYCAVVADRLGSRVKSYATFNEPWCVSILSNELGHHAPGKFDRKAALAVAHHLHLAHGLALQRLRAMNLTSQLGIVLNLTPAYPATESEADKAEAWLADGKGNRWFLDPILKGSYPQDVWDHYSEDVRPTVLPGDLELASQPIDFMGINYYTRSFVSTEDKKLPENTEYTDMGWEVYPSGLSDLLIRLNGDYNLPDLYITENGAAYPDVVAEDGHVHDEGRVNYLREHFKAAHQTIEAGVPLKGYFVWSLMDNFEWAFGYSKRFGVVYVDYESQKRILKDSALWYQDFLKQQ
ncbi:GH1 family beta-glucosidase [Deinococcus cellulosilyticus]|uniref:Beta-glucosidase n=1 Tax=Deinococcus cellulosilyticus (strain DSM 18568 / NBRC 106333 / KACC 11606 / 5516J-15) TaxID=1223518 RepID=A0A511NC44_DEIC1|nr:GH1 family beta-glucosidase [Deinococcus cellulosilyticus]GEM50068.1 beta-glucosidase [Deinococcus cellulosilyticus NBRC 106333 = KACC 11606]